MRHAMALTLILALLASSGLASAEYGRGSSLEIDAPAELRDRVDTLVNQGIVSVISADRTTNLVASITAKELSLRYVSVTSCAVAGQSCPPGVNDGDNAPVDRRLTDATVVVTRALDTYQIVATNDQQRYGDTSSFGTPGPIVATTGGKTMLDATRARQYVSPYSHGWSTSQPQGFTDDVYTVDVDQATTSAASGSIRAAGGFEVLFQGLELQVRGTDADGRSYSETFRTARTSDSSGETINFLVVEATNGLLSVTTKAPIVAHQVWAVDSRGGAVVKGATGTVKTDGGTQQHDRADLTLPGPLEMSSIRVKSGSPPRLAFAISSILSVYDDAQKNSEEPTSVGELAAAGAAGAGGAAMLAAIVYFWPRLKFFASALLIPLYTRIQRSEVLEHEKRDEIYTLIQGTPGIHAHEIGQRASIGWGTTVYHLKLLESHSLVVSKKSGRYKRFFVNTGEFTKKKDVYGALRNDTAKAVADFVINHPGSSQKELCAALGIQPSLASWHVQKLEAVDLVKRVKDGRQVRYYAGGAWAELDLSHDTVAGASELAKT